MKGQTYIILAFIFALLIAIFAVINVDPVQVNYLFGSGESPLILVILISVLLGGLATASVGAVRYFKLKKENRLLRENNTSSETSTSLESTDHEDGKQDSLEHEDSSSKVT